MAIELKEPLEASFLYNFEQEQKLLFLGGRMINEDS